MMGEHYGKSSGEARERDQFAFLAQAVHELRSPLAMLTCYAELLADPYFRNDEEKLDEILQTITKQGRQISQMVESIDFAARVEEEQRNPINNPIPFQPFIAEIVAGARQNAGREIELDDQAGPIEIFGNPLRLRYALLALIDNASKFTPDDKPVRVGVQLTHARKHVKISVMDQGIGIAPQEMKVLFTRFGRIKNEQTKGIPGSGLGLFIVRRIIQQHSGEITVISRRGKGSTFIVNLPVPQINRPDMGQ